MKLIDRMIKKAKTMVSNALMTCFGLDNTFIEALGLDPEKYKVNFPNGDYGYDDLSALEDVTPDVWKEYQD